MDKITRILLLYSKLINGEKINKNTFCLEFDCSKRTFDRDIEDIRLYLSEIFDSEELIYDRSRNLYYFFKQHTCPLETIEYLFIERLLVDANILRSDELYGLLSHLAQNTQQINQAESYKDECMKLYKDKYNNVPLIKMHGDLQVAIRNKYIIDIVYNDNNCNIVNQIIIPCDIKYSKGSLYLTSYDIDNKIFCNLRINDIYSFSIIRKQNENEIKLVSSNIWHNNLKMNNHIEILIKCNKNIFDNIVYEFDNVEKIDETDNMIIIKLIADENKFIKWIFTQPTEHIKVLKPKNIIKKLKIQAQTLLNTYSEV